MNHLLISDAGVGDCTSCPGGKDRNWKGGEALIAEQSQRDTDRYWDILLHHYRSTKLFLQTVETSCLGYPGLVLHNSALIELQWKAVPLSFIKGYYIEIATWRKFSYLQQNCRWILLIIIVNVSFEILHSIFFNIEYHMYLLRMLHMYAYTHTHKHTESGFQVCFLNEAYIKLCFGFILSSWKSESFFSLWLLILFSPSFKSFYVFLFYCFLLLFAQLYVCFLSKCKFLEVARESINIQRIVLNL